MKPQAITLKTLFGTKKDIENPRIFLINTEIATRKWILRDTNEDIEKKNV
jgi:hypothetical protein